MRAANGQFVKGSHWRRPALHWDAALRFDHSNAVTLCRSCHAWVHSNNNKNKEFLQ